MRRIITSVIFLLALAAHAPAQPKDELINPRGTAPAGAAAQVEARSLDSSLLLVAALLAAAGGWWFWQKRRSSVRAGTTGAARLAILESRSLGSRQYLVVADYEGKKFLLGVCPGSIELLTPLDGGEPTTKT